VRPSDTRASYCRADLNYFASRADAALLSFAGTQPYAQKYSERLDQVLHDALSTEEGRKKPCKTRTPTAEEGTIADSTASELGRSRRNECREVGARIAELRKAGTVLFFDQRYDAGGKILFGDQTRLDKSKPVELHIYSGATSNWTPAFLVYGAIRPALVEEAAHTLGYEHDARNGRMSTEQLVTLCLFSHP
jgi:hypothetical protein